MPHIDAPGGGFGDAWAPDIHAFAAHWKSMRDGELMPATERFMDNPRARFVSSSYLVELTSAGAMVRFQGADLIHFWMRDFTGIELHSGRWPDLKDQSVGNMRHVVERPCGYIASLSFNTDSGRTQKSDLLQLPLRVKPGRPPRLVCFAHVNAAVGWQETFTRYLEIHQAAWLDIGAGIPGDPPYGLHRLD